MILWPPLGHNSGLQRTGSQSAPSRTILMAAGLGGQSMDIWKVSEPAILVIQRIVRVSR